MITNGVPTSEIIRAIEDGFPLSEEAIFIIINHGRAQLIDDLIPFGLNVYAKHKGLNALDYAKKINQKNVEKKLYSYY